MGLYKFYKWFDNQKKINKFEVKKRKLTKIKNWKIDTDKVFHITNKFFKIIAIKVKSNYYKKNWDQPIILQNEIGILGIIKDNKTKKYLLQAKVEPGNINKLQLAPSVQATESNYKSVHGGKKVPYVKLFYKIKSKKKYLQSEHGFRYFNKFNSNILLKINKTLKRRNNFFWFSKNDIKNLILKKNILNMDTLSVFSTVIKKVVNKKSINSKTRIHRWFEENDKKYFIKSKQISLSSLKDWSINESKIFHKDKKHFSVIGIDVKTSKRENNKWSQPILSCKEISFVGFIKTYVKDQAHYLCKYILKPGLQKSVIGCTVNTSDFFDYSKDKNLSFLDNFFIKNFFFKKNSSIEYDNILSDEGGRFYKCQRRYMITNINLDQLPNISNNYIWLSHNQIIDLIKHKRLDIESRLLFTCCNIENIM